MDKTQLQRLLDAEVDAWSRKSYAELVEALPDVVAYSRGGDADFHQFEMELIEREPDYVHVMVAVDDGRLARALSPLTRSFIVHRDGRVER